MSSAIRVIVLPLLLLLISVAPASAIELAMPSDFFTFTVTVPGSPPGGYYYLNPFVENPSAGPRIGFGLVLDSTGEVVLFRNEGEITNIEAVEHSTQYSYGYPGSSYPEKLRLYNSGWEVVEEVHREHPSDPQLILDGHEYLWMEDGTRWTEWWDVRTVDMSQHIPGGLPEVTVHGHAIQHMDEDGTVLWDWRSWDHLDDLPFTARPDCTKLYTEEFEHLHVNSLDIKDDYIYVSARFTCAVYKISRATGEVVWGIGYGPANDFTFSGPPNVPLDFNYQHDARILDNGNLTVFDNGNAHDPAYAYAKEYVLDETNMTAELVWWLVNDPPSLAAITGSHRKLDNGNHVVGWGNINPHVAAVEVNDVGQVLWKLEFDRYQPYSRWPGTYRVNKSNQFTPSYRPYVSYSDLGNHYELQCNWFGHEDEVYGYDIYCGYAEDDLVYCATSDDGYYHLPQPSPLIAYYFQIVAIDENGNTISDVSNLLRTRGYDAPMYVTPVGSTVIQPGGGNLTFNLTAVNPSPYPLNNLHLTTFVELPNSLRVGPLINGRFRLNPYQTRTVQNIVQPVPAFAPAGDYNFIARVRKNSFDFVDAFPFEKLPAAARLSAQLEPTIVGWHPQTQHVAEWFTDSDTGQKRSTELVSDGVRVSTHPNPFNSITTVQLNLPEAGEVELSVYNLTGQLVATVVNGNLGAGMYEYEFDASHLASGLYFIRTQVVGHSTAVQKVMLVR